MVEIDYRVWADVGACDHRKAFQHKGVIALSAYSAIFALLRVRTPWRSPSNAGGAIEGRIVGAPAVRKVVMTSHRTVFNHVGLCVADRGRSRRFYEGLLGFQFWWELEVPDDGAEQLLQLAKPLGVHATYLVRDGFVLELIDFTEREVRAGQERVMDQVGLTHISFSVSDLGGVLEQVEGFGGAVVDETVSAQSAMIRDPDGQLLELLSDGWLSVLPPRQS